MNIRQARNVTKFWHVSQWRLMLKGKTGSAVTSFDYDAWEQWLRDQAEVERQRQERLAADREKQAHVDHVRLERYEELKAKVTAKRQHIYRIQHRYASKEEVLQELQTELTSGELLKDVPICAAEISWCWASGALWKYSCGFIYDGTLAEISVLWEQVPVLQPLEQQPDARGNIKLRNNSRRVRKLRHAKHCLLKALLFATEERVRAAHRPAHPPACPPARPPAC